MIKRTIVLLLVAVCPCQAGPVGADSSRGIVVPRELHDFALSEKCVPVGNFYDRPGLVRPPYIYDDKIGGEPAAALWCRDERSKGARYILLFRRGRGSVGQGTCPSRIPDQTHIGGLSLVYKSDLKLDRFRFMESPARSGPPSQSLEDVAIRSEYDGVGAIYYCHQGQWLIHEFD